MSSRGVPVDVERDDSDATAVHVVASCDGEVVGTARLTRDEEARIGRVAVLPSLRRQGIAGLMLATLEAEARKLGVDEVSLHSQSYVQSLYDKLGYKVTGAPFVEAGIDHVPMSKRLGLGRGEGECAGRARRTDPKIEGIIARSEPAGVLAPRYLLGGRNL